MYCRACSPPELPEFKIAKDEEELKADQRKREAAGSTNDPRDPRFKADQINSMEDLEYMTKWMLIPQGFRDINKRTYQPSKNELRVCRELAASTHLNMSICYFTLKNH